MRDPFAFDDTLDPVDFNDFLLETPTPRRVVIPGLINVGDRWVLTGDEGKGKSTLLDQVGFQTAGGVQPFTLQPMEAQPVLRLDFENDRDESRINMQSMRDRSDLTILHGMYTLQYWPQGLNVLDDTGETLIRTWIRTFAPKLVIVGPIYKMANSDLVDSHECKPFVDLWDRLRMEYQFAVIMEHHMPHTTNSVGKRVSRPVGWSGWLRWPEFGKYLTPAGDLEDWRGDRHQREWGRFYRDTGGPWLWMPWKERKVSYDEVLITALALLKETGKTPSQRAIATRLNTNQPMVSRVIKANEMHYLQALVSA